MRPDYFTIKVSTRPHHSEVTAGTSYAHADVVLGSDETAKCPQCGQGIRIAKPSPPLRIVSGDMWPDFVGASTLSRRWYVSERVVDYITKVQLPTVSAHSIGEVSIRSNNLKMKNMPNYFDVMVGVKIPIAYENETGPSGTYCRQCSQAIDKHFHPRFFVEPRFSEWTVPGLAKLDSLSTSEVYCKWDFVEMVRSQRWTGVAIYPYPQHCVEAKAPLAIDHFADQWPPQAWFA